MKHKHHIIPKHMGGTDDTENLIELTIEEHADAHRILFEKYGKIEDYWAWKGLSGQIGKEEILREICKNNGKKVYENKLGIFSMSKDERKEFCSKGGKTSGQKNSNSGHCQNIAHLGGKASAGMKFWYNILTDEETRSFESPGDNWIPGVKMERINIEQLRKQSNNRKNSFWIHNPETGESKMIFNIDEIPDGFIEGRNLEIKNTIDLLNVGDNSDLDLKKIKSEFSDIHFDNWYKRWVFTFKMDNRKNKITHIDYFTLVWARDSIINFYNLDLIKSKLNFTDIKSKEEVIETLKSFREYLKIEKILQEKLKKSKVDIYNRKLDSYSSDYNYLIKIRNKFL
jgi:hypothetical protein